MAQDEAEQLLIQSIRKGDEAAWTAFINRYEGRLTAFVNSRIQNRTASEDIVQDAFMGFLISLPNYDDRCPIESYLFTITAHKLTDHLRREGRRPVIPLFHSDSQRYSPNEPMGRERKASSMARSGERKVVEENIISACIQELIQSWKTNEEFERLQCIELLLVLGWKNKEVSNRLGISEQAVANHKHFAVNKLKEAASNAHLRGFQLSDWGIEE
jgi:RNA polymerase sigma-70 factor, ECF subfamily